MLSSSISGILPKSGDPLDFGPHKYGAELVVNYPEFPESSLGPVVVDVETDEKDAFVGIGLCNNEKKVYYYSVLTDELKEYLSNADLIGHNVKFDAHRLKAWGVRVDPKSLVADTALMAYVQNSTRESQSLKDLAKDLLRMSWPTYKEMVGMGRNKTTLDKQDVDRVARYCGMDALATFRLYQHLLKKLTPEQKRFYSQIELPTMQLLFGMEEVGIRVDVSQLKAIQAAFETTRTDLLSKLKAFTHEGFNPASPKQVKEALASLGIVVTSTNKQALENLKDSDFVDTLFKFREASKLLGTYVEPLLARSPVVHCEFNQVAFDKADGEWKGIRTGRLSSSNPNLQNIPSKGDIGPMVRKCFVPKPGYHFIVADYSQIEYRLLAHFSQEPRLIDVYKNDRDVHEETGTLLGSSREIGKTLNFASIYGAQAKKIAFTAKVSEEEAEDFLKAYWRELPRVVAWVNRTKALARVHGKVKTLLGREIPLPGIYSDNMFERFHWERAAVNYVIQGSAADIIKLAMLKAQKVFQAPILQVHDELIFEVTDNQQFGTVTVQARLVNDIMSSTVSLSVPLKVSVGIGPNWEDAKV